MKLDSKDTKYNKGKENFRGHLNSCRGKEIS